jgi:hypothetical protein
MKYNFEEGIQFSLILKVRLHQNYIGDYVYIYIYINKLINTKS